MKKVLFVIVAVLLAAATLLFLLKKPSGEEKLLTGSKNKLTRVEIILEPNSSPIKLTFEDRETMARIYEKIERSNDLRVNTKPEHEESMQSDSRFDITLFYEGNTSDDVKSTETGETIYRFLDTVGSSGDSGYVIAKNKVLLPLLQELAQ